MTDPRLARIDLLTAAMGREIDRVDPAAETGWPELPDVAALVRHVGFVHRWVVAVLTTRGRVRDEAVPVDAGTDLAGWFEEGRLALSIALAAVPPDAPCWVFGSAAPTAGFWRRRMVIENVKHLIDLRAAGGGRWTAAPELKPSGYADGIDELLDVMLPRTRAGLAPLPGPVLLSAIDTGDLWRIGADWTIGRRADADETARVEATAADLALALWERADPVADAERFRVSGDAAAVGALRAAAIHPW